MYTQLLYLTPRFSVMKATQITPSILLAFQNSTPATTFPISEQPLVDTSARHDDVLTALVPDERLVHQHV